jgi:hypothetical protein
MTDNDEWTFDPVILEQSIEFLSNVNGGDGF